MSRIPKNNAGGGLYASTARNAAALATANIRGSRLVKAWNAAEAAAYQAMAKLPLDTSAEDLTTAAREAACRAVGQQAPLEIGR